MPIPLRAGRGAGQAPARPGLRRRFEPILTVLESRQLLAGLAPTDEEQYLLELINQARANPAAEGQRLLAVAATDPVIHAAVAGWNLGTFESLISGVGPLPPLAFDPRLNEAATDQSVSMLITNSQIHSPAGYLTNPAVATASDGQAFFPTGAGAWATGENVYAYSAGVDPSSMENYANYFNDAFLIDWGNPDFSHLDNTLAPGPGEYAPGGHLPYSVIGIGLLPNAHPTTPSASGANVGPVIVTEEFGWRQGQAALTGVIYQDSNGNDFYDPGEGLGGVSIVAVGLQGQGAYSTQTWGSGGYTLPLPPGLYSVTAAGGGLAAPRTTTVAVGLDNVEWDVQLAPNRPVVAVGPAQIAVFRPTTSTWYVQGPGAGGGASGVQFGQGTLWGGDPVPVPGAGAIKITAFQPATSTFFIQGVGAVQFGQGTNWGGDPVPIAGNYNGQAELAVFQPDTSTFYIQGVGAVQFGQGRLYGGDPIPLVGDFLGNGRDQLAVYQPSTSTFYIQGVGAIQFGQGTLYGGDPKPVIADFDGDGRADLAVYQPSTSTFVIRPSSDPSHPYAVQFGQGTLYGGSPIAAAADYNGDGKADLAIYQQATGTWYVRPSNGAPGFAVAFGQGGTDQPVPGRYALPPISAAMVAGPPPSGGDPGAAFPPPGGVQAGGVGAPPSAALAVGLAAAHRRLRGRPAVAQRAVEPAAAGFRYRSRNSSDSLAVRSMSAPPQPWPAPTSSSTRPGTPAAVIASARRRAWVWGTSGSFVPWKVSVGASSLLT